MKSEIEKLVIENGELDNCPSGKLLAERMKKNSIFVKIYKDYKLDSQKNIEK